MPEEATIRVRSDDGKKPEDEEEKKDPSKPASSSTSAGAASSADDEKEKKEIIPLDEADIALLKSYGSGPYAASIKSTEDDIAKLTKDINSLKGIKESDTGLAPPSSWDLIADKQLMQSEQPLQVARCTKIINAGQEDAKYVINVRQIAKYVVGLGDRVSATDIEEGMRCGVDRQNKMQIQIPLPPKIDPSVTMMTVEEKPDVTYAEVGGCKEQIEKIREVVEMPMLNPERFIALGIDPPKGVLLYGPPGTGKTLLARAVANQTDAVFIRVIGSELVQKYVGEGARMVRELFQLARSKKAAIVFFDEVDAIGGARFDDGAGGDNEVQRTMLQIVTELDGFDARGNVKVLMATNRPDTLDPALMRPGRLDRKIEFNLPDLEGRTKILSIHSKSLNCDRNIRWELIARLCPNTTGAELRSVCIAAGTPVGLADGTSVPIEQLRIGQTVLSYQKGGVAPTAITAVHDQGVKECVELLFSDGRRLVCTSDHRLLRADGQWVAAGELTVAGLHHITGGGTPKKRPSAQLVPGDAVLVSVDFPLSAASQGGGSFRAAARRALACMEVDQAVHPVNQRWANVTPPAEMGLTGRPDVEQHYTVTEVLAKCDVRRFFSDRRPRYQPGQPLQPVDQQQLAHGTITYGVHAAAVSLPVFKLELVARRRVDPVRVYDISVSAGESFLARGIVVHNCTEAGMFAIRARRKAVTEADMLEAVQKVIKGYAKFSATPKYMVYN